jgi:phage terminase large subunit GpA-like protein
MASNYFGYWRSYASRDNLHYKIVKRKRMELANWQCEHCGAKDKLSIHHVTYERIFNETLEDVRILCRKCHTKADVERRREERKQRTVEAMSK